MPQKHLRDFIIITVAFLLFGSAIASAVIVRNIFEVPERAEQSKKVSTTKISAVSDIKLVFTTSTKSGPELPHTIDTTHITLAGMPNTEVMVFFNNQFHEIVKKSVAEFTQYYSEMPEPNSDGTLPEKNSYSNKFEVLYISPRVVSLFHQVRIYKMGSAHGIIGNSSATFDGYLQKQIALTDLFNTRTQYIQFFSDTVTPILKERLQDAFFETGTTPDPQNFNVWGLGSDGFIFAFDAYHVGPYAAGTQTVIIPYSALQPYLSEYGKEIVEYIQTN